MRKYRAKLINIHKCVETRWRRSSFNKTRLRYSPDHNAYQCGHSNMK